MGDLNLATSDNELHPLTVPLGQFAHIQKHILEDYLKINVRCFISGQDVEGMKYKKCPCSTQISK